MGSLPNIEDCENFTEGEAVNYIHDVIQNLEQTKTPFDSSIIHDFIFRLSQAYFDYNHNTINKISEVFVNDGLVELLSYYLSRLSDPVDIKNRTLKLLLTLIANYSNHSPQFTKEIAKYQLTKLTIDNCMRNILVDDMAQKDYYDFIWKCVVIIHNVVRDQSVIIKHRMDEFKNFLVRLVECYNNDKLGVVSLLTLSYLVGETDKNLLEKGEGFICILIGKIRFSFENGSKCGGYSLLELLQGLRCLSANDSLKWQLFIDGAPTILMDILQTEDRSNDEIDEALGTMEHLCFHKDIRDKLRNELKLIVQRFSQHENENVRKHCNGIRWKLSEEAKSFHRQNQKAMKDERKGDRYEFDVFVSYSRANQSRVRQIVSRLKAKSIRAWIDEEQMGSGIERSTLEFMANGIERSRLFILAISPSYKASACCRDEAEYAHLLRKPILPVILEWKYKPDSWLGIIVRTRFYYELSDRRADGERVMGDLLRSIERRLEIDANEVGEQVDKSNDRSGRISGDCFELGNNIGNWEVEDVQQWLDRSNLSHLGDHLKSIDGPLLAMMGKMRTKAPEYFNRALENQFGMDLIDVMKLHMALDKLGSGSFY